jgi:hypothetical protein
MEMHLDSEEISMKKAYISTQLVSKAHEKAYISIQLVSKPIAATAGGGAAGGAAARRGEGQAQDGRGVEETAAAPAAVAPPAEYKKLIKHRLGLWDSVLDVFET